MNRTEMIERLEVAKELLKAPGTTDADRCSAWGKVGLVLEALRAEEAQSDYKLSDCSSYGPTLEERVASLEKQVEHLSWKPTAVSVGEVVKKTVRTEMEALKESGGAQ